jgi:hypothetical protein
MSEKANAKWKAFALWLDSPESTRAISTEEDWAASNGVTARTLRRWKQDPEFAALRASLGGAPTVTVDVTDDGSDEASYRAVKAQLVAGARIGNAKALELYFKTYGKPFVEEEVAARTLDLESVELPGLVARAVAALSADELESALTSLGWRVERPVEG